MFHCLVNIENTSSQSFTLKLNVSFDIQEDGNWKTEQEGNIRFNNGWSFRKKSEGTLTTCHIALYSSEDTWGIRLNDFIDFWGPNKKGDGLLLQPWAISFQPGLIYWKLIETH